MGYRIVPAQGDPFGGAKAGRPHRGAARAGGVRAGAAAVARAESYGRPQGSLGADVGALAGGGGMGLGQEIGGIATSLASAFKAPGDILAGRLKEGDPRFEESARDAAGMLGGGLLGAEEGAAGMFGGRLRSGAGATERSGFDFTWPDKWKGPKKDWATFTTDDGSEFRVGFFKEPGNREAYIAFNAVLDGEEKDELTGLAGNTAHKVLSTVLNTTEHYLRENPRVKNLSFDADANEPSRVLLYRLLARKLSKNVEERPVQLTGSDKNYIRFRVRIPDYVGKESK